MDGLFYWCLNHTFINQIMKSGAIGVITTDHGNSGMETNIFPQTRTEEGYNLRTSLEVEWGQEVLDGSELYKGQVATESLTDIKTTRIQTDGRIVAGEEETDVVTHTTDFLRVPGEFVLTESTTDQFAYDVLEESTAESICNGQVDLESFADAHSEAKPWMSWFRMTGSPIDSGAAYGDIDSAPELAKYVHRNENSQLGLEQLKFNGRHLKLVISESGWIAVYQPKDMDSIEFTRFIQEEVLPHTIPDV